MKAEEISSYRRADIVLRLPQNIYVSELKYGKNVGADMEQLHLKNYAAKWSGDDHDLGIRRGIIERQHTEQRERS
ncbi:MAG: hypothetical protein IJM58_02480 [Muribaculaceae bacterium]|nr:hypothetical protein [Muribaculaceae bacterium]